MEFNLFVFFARITIAALFVIFASSAAYGSNSNESKESDMNASRQTSLSAACKVLDSSDVFAGNNKIDWATAKTKLTEGEDFTTYTFAMPQVVQSQLYTCLFAGREVHFPKGGYLFFQTEPRVPGSTDFSPDGSVNRFSSGTFAFPNANPGQVIGLGLPSVLSERKPKSGVHMYKSASSLYVLKYAGTGIPHGFLNNADGDLCVNFTVNDVYPQDDYKRVSELSKIYRDVQCNIVVLTGGGVTKLKQISN